MKIEIIPAINADSFEEIEVRIKLVEPFVSSAVGGAGWVQLDVADGTFTKNATWHNAENLLKLETFLKIEVHLMISNIEEQIGNWLIAPVNRVIFHLEAAKNPDFIIKACKKENKEVGIAIAPATSWIKLVPYLDEIDLVQVLAVYPGLAGQEFQEECWDKIRHLRLKCQKCIIEVDGGINKETARKAKEAGANIVVAASAIFGSKNIGHAIGELCI